MFWIVSRQAASDGGDTSTSGDILTLYQAVSTDQRPSNGSTDDYTVENKGIVNLALDEWIANNVSPLDAVSFTQNGSDLDKSVLR